MKKRIGSKLYDTDSSELVADVGVGILYRKKTRDRQWFLVVEKGIEPLDETQAYNLLGEIIYHDKPVDEKRIMIGIYRETHKKIMKIVKQDNIKVADAVKKVVDGYLRDI